MLKEKKFKNLLTTSKSNTGFTLIEMLVAVAIFVTTVTVVSTIFVSSLRAQRQSLAYQQLLEQTSYLMEYMSRAIRMAKKDDIDLDPGPAVLENDCLGGERGVNYEFTSQCLKFRNYNNECQQFCLDGNKIVEKKGPLLSDLTSNDLTSPDLRVNSFGITLIGETQNDNLQPLVSISLDIVGKEQSRIQIQTSISQRDLDIQK